MSKLYVDRTIFTLDGKVFEPKTTLREAMFNALTTHIPSNRDLGIKGDESLSMEEKLKIHKLAGLVLAPGKEDERVIELDVAQINTIRTRCGTIFSNHFFGQVAEMLEDGKMPDLTQVAAPAAAEPT